MKFLQAVEHILKYEGGYVNDPKDPGGETNFGISKRSFPELDILNLTKTQAKNIYKTKYWDRLQLDKFPAYIRLSLFDTAVLQGPMFAVTTLQKLTMVYLDGIAGPVTVASAHSVNPEKLLRNYTHERIMRFARLSHFDRFGSGWTKRAIDCLMKSMRSQYDTEA